MKVLDVTGNAADIFYVLLMYSGQYDFLPELYEVLGRESTVQLLDIFSGVTVKFPPEKLLTRLAAEVNIYLRIKRASEKKRAIVIKDLSDEHLLEEDVIRDIYARTTTILEDKLGFEVLLGTPKPKRFREQKL